MRIHLLTTFVCLSAVSTASAVRISVDATRDPYAVGSKRVFDSVVKIEMQNYHGGDSDYASAVMLTDTIGITAASVFQGRSDKFIVDPQGGNVLLTDLDIKQHPGFRPSGFNARNDLAMFRIPTALPGVSTSKINRRSRPNALLDEVATYVGFDINGSDGALQPIGFRNRIDTIVDKNNLHLLKMDLDEAVREENRHDRFPTVSGEFDPLNLEGVIEDGELGGGLFVRNARGKWRLTGVGSFGTHEFDDSYGGTSGRTAVGGFTNVASYKEWIDFNLDERNWQDVGAFDAKTYTIVGVLDDDFDEVLTDAAIHLVNAVEPQTLDGVAFSALLASEPDLPADSVVSPVPEPSSVALAVAMTCCFGISFRGRRRLNATR